MERLALACCRQRLYFHLAATPSSARCELHSHQTMSYPFRYYGTDPTGEQEIIFRVKLAGAPHHDLRGRIIACFPGPPGDQFDDSASFDAALEEQLVPGLVYSLWHEEWALVYQDLGEPSAHPDDADIWRKAFERAHEIAPLDEVVALAGTSADWEPDAWSAWSLAQQPPAQGPSLPFTDQTPYGDLREQR